MRSRVVLPAVMLMLAIIACGPLGAITSGEQPVEQDAVATLPPEVDAQPAEADAPVEEPIEGVEEAPIVDIEISELAPLQYTAGEGLDVLAMALSPDGTQLATTGWTGGAVSLVVFIDTATGVATLTPEERTGWGLNNTITYMADGGSVVITDLVAILGEFDSTTFDLTTEDRFDPYPGDDTIQMVAGSNDDTIYTLVSTGEVAEVRVPSGEVINRSQVFDSRDVVDLTRLANGNLIAIGADTEFDQTKMVVELAPNLSELVAVPVQLPVSAAGSADGSLIALHTALNGQIFLVGSVLELPDAEPIGQFCNDRSDIAFSPAGNLMAITATRCSHQIYDVATGQLVFDSNDSRGGRGAAFSPDGTRLYLGTDDRGVAVYEVPVPEGFVAAEPPPATEPETPADSAEEGEEASPDAESAAPVDGDEIIPIPQNDEELDLLPFADDSLPFGEAATFCPEILPDTDFENIFGVAVLSRFPDDFESLGAVIACRADFEDGTGAEVIFRLFPGSLDAQLWWVEEQYFISEEGTATLLDGIGDRAAYIEAPAGEATDTPAVLHFYVNDYYVLMRTINTTTGDDQRLLETLADLVIQNLAGLL